MAEQNKQKGRYNVSRSTRTGYYANQLKRKKMGQLDLPDTSASYRSGYVQASYDDMESYRYRAAKALGYDKNECKRISKTKGKAIELQGVKSQQVFFDQDGKLLTELRFRQKKTKKGE